jgi:hypothetical protein
MIFKDVSPTNDSLTNQPKNSLIQSEESCANINSIDPTNKTIKDVIIFQDKKNKKELNQMSEAKNRYEVNGDKKMSNQVNVDKMVNSSDSQSLKTKKSVKEVHKINSSKKRGEAKQVNDQNELNVKENETLSASIESSNLNIKADINDIISRVLYLT